MKSTLLFVAITLNFNISGYGQTEWTKADRTTIYDECYSETIKSKNLTNQQRESLSLCMLDEITSKYTRKEYLAKIVLGNNKYHSQKQSEINIEDFLNTDFTNENSKEENKIDFNNLVSKI